MALNPLTPRLRVFNKSNAVAKVSIALAPGDELEVSADVAGQLEAQRAPVAPAGKATKAKATEEATEPAKPKRARKATKKAAG